MRPSIVIGVAMALLGTVAEAQVQTQELSHTLAVLHRHHHRRRHHHEERGSPTSGTRCRVGNPTPEGKEAIRWEGACPGGTAQGPGVLQWFKDGQPTDRYEGELKNGRMEGHGIWITADDDRYEGMFRNGWAEGQEAGAMPPAIPIPAR